MAQLRLDQTVIERTAIIEDALARVLHRDSTLEVRHDGGERYLWVYDGPGDGVFRLHPLWTLARELEALLA